MFIALNKKGKRIWAEKAERGNLYYCPICHTPVIYKNGQFKATHFAHKCLKDCDSWSSSENELSNWHMDWQKRFDEDYREIVLTQTWDEVEWERAVKNHQHFKNPQDEIESFRKIYDIENSKEIALVHRTDIKVNNWCIEFQHSPISPRIFAERCAFYTKNNSKLCWVFDMNEKDIAHIRTKENGHLIWSWGFAADWAKQFSPQDEKNIELWFDFEGLVYKVSWAPFRGDQVTWRRFTVSPGISYEEFVEEKLKKTRFVFNRNQGIIIDDKMKRFQEMYKNRQKNREG